jgi:hypothetical protein
MDDLTIIGIGSLFFGFIFFALGILLLFDRALLTMSNFFFLCSAIIFMKPKGFF